MRYAWPSLAALLILMAAPAAQAAPLVSQADSNVLCAAWKDLGFEPTPARIEMSGAVASFESGFGRGWKASGIFSKNWGAIHAAVPTCIDGTRSNRCPGKERPSCPPGTFLHKDSDAQGPYQACFRAYPTPRHAAIDFVKVLIHRTPCRTVEGSLAVLDAIDTGDSFKVAEALWATCYFTTYRGASDPDVRVQAYADAIDRHRAPRVCADWLLAPNAGSGTPVAQLVGAGSGLGMMMLPELEDPAAACVGPGVIPPIGWWQ